MTDAQRRLDEVINRHAKKLAPVAGTGSRRRWGTVSEVDDGPPFTVTILLETGEVGPLRCLDTGVPINVDDYVFVENVDGDMVVIGKVIVSALVVQAPLYVITNTQLLDYTLQLTDADGVVIEALSASPTSWTVPPSIAAGGTVDWVVNTTIEGFQAGTGQVTMVEGTNVDFQSYGSRLKSAGQYATWGFRYRGFDGTNDKWALSGNLTT